MANKKGSKKIKKIKIELTPLSLFLWSLFLLFLLAWVFLLGILVARDMLPDFRNPFKKSGETTSQNEEYEKPKKDPVFNFYDHLESKKNEVKRRSIPRKEKEPDQEITLSRNETADSSENSKPAELNKEEQIKPLSKAALQDYFSVQIAAVSIPERAQKLVKELVDQDYDAYYYSATINGKTTYRIMSGRFSKRSDAVVCLKKLKKDTGYKGFIVKFGK
jgi:septal ring-binding cell division protein DamX